MIADAKISKLEISDPLAKLRLSTFPGNSQGATTIPDQADPRRQLVAGEQPSSWSSWYQAAKDTVTWPFRAASSAYDVVKNAPANTAALIKDARDSVTETAGAFSTWTKWIVVGLVALAVIYVVGFAKSVAPGKP